VSGLPTVLVPGLLCTGELFAPQVAALQALGPVIVASTTEGETMAAIAEAILDATPPRFALAGSSMGGYVCFEILRRAPERVARLALLSTSARPDTAVQTAQRGAYLAEGRADLRAALERSVPRLQHPAHRDDAALVAIQVRMGLEVGIEAFERQTRAAIGRPDSRPLLPHIAVPTLVLVGDRDPLTPPMRSREIAQGIPDARLVVVPECGHAATLEQPAAVAAELAAWRAS